MQPVMHQYVTYTKRHFTMQTKLGTCPKTFYWLIENHFCYCIKKQLFEFCAPIPLGTDHISKINSNMHDFYLDSLVNITTTSEISEIIDYSLANLPQLIDIMRHHLSRNLLTVTNNFILQA